MSEETKPVCPKCNKAFSNSANLKTHMSDIHGGYDVDDLKSAGIKPTRKDIARNMAGNTSSTEVSKQAPDSEGKIGEGTNEPSKRGRRSKPPSDPAIEEAKERILRARCERAASLPYSILASITGEEEIRLSQNEKQDLTEAYLTLSKAYGWEGTGKLILWSDVLICQVAIIAKPERKEAFGRAIGNIGSQPEKADEPQPE